MRAAQIVAFKQPYEVRDVPIPTPRYGELLIKSGAAGFCHTDLMVRDGVFEWLGTKPPITGSHEAVGTIHAVGSGVEGFQKGDRIGAINLLHPCKRCPDCQREDYMYCSSPGGMIGLDRDGAFAEYVIVDAHVTARLPDNLDFVQAAPLMCAGGTIYEAIKKCNLEKGSLLGIVGLGALGSLGVQFAKAMGYKTVGVDTREEPINMVQSAEFPHPPDLVLNPTVDKEASEFLPKLTAAVGTSKEGYEGLDAVIVATEPIPAFEYGIKLLRKHGLLMVVGQPEPKIPIKDRDFIFKDITVRGAILPANAGRLREMLEVVSNNGIKSTIKTYKLEDINKMVEDYELPNMKGKFVVEF